MTKFVHESSKDEVKKTIETLFKKEVNFIEDVMKRQKKLGNQTIDYGNFHLSFPYKDRKVGYTIYFNDSFNEFMIYSNAEWMIGNHEFDSLALTVNEVKDFIKFMKKTTLLKIRLENL